MAGQNYCAPNCGEVEARGNTGTDRAGVAQDAAAGKAVAVWLYCIGARSREETRATFARHPEWREV